MRPFAVSAALLAAAQAMLAPPSFAQTGDTQRLLQVIEEQQRRLDAQEAQLAEQKKALQELRRQVEAVQAGAPPPAASQDGTAGASAAQSSPVQEPAKAPVAAAKDDWPGSVAVGGTDTRFKISGFVEFDAMHDSKAILTPSAFVTNAIVTRDATAAQGAKGQTNLSVQPTRVAIETRTPLHDQRLTTFVAVDFFNNFGSTSPSLRLRQAYGEISNVLFGGDLLFGQDWSTYSNLYSIPNVLDFQTPNAVFGTRHPMVRWTKGVGKGLKLKLAAEAPDLRSFEGASSASRWPDGVVALSWEHGPVNLQGSLLARDLRASGPNGSVTSDFGWGASVAGRLYMPGSLKQDFLTFSLTRGEGIGGVLNDIPPDASYDTQTNELKAIPTTAWLAGYQHWWNPKFYSVISYGEVRQSNPGFQAATAYRRTRYSSVNLTWTPYAQWLFGVELLYGSREDKDGAFGSDVRTQFTSRFTF